MIEHVVDGCNCSGKRCPGCEQVKCRGVFDPSLLRFDGLQPYCGECRREKRRESHGRDTNREANKRWCQNHRDYNRERNRPHVRNYWERNQEKYRAQSRAYYEANQDRLREQKDTYRRNNLEAYAVREANRRARKAKAGGSFTQQEWHDLCAYYDYTCLRCVTPVKGHHLSGEQSPTSSGNGSMPNVSLTPERAVKDQSMTRRPGRAMVPANRSVSQGNLDMVKASFLCHTEE